ncbi:MAG: hypothetical protein QXG00_05470 [Candidatus Woesearchaeota archaeon]
MNINRRKAQTWSTDLILGVVVFVLIIAVIYTIITQKPQTKPTELQQEAMLIGTRLDYNSNYDSLYTVIQDGEINNQRLERLPININFETGTYEQAKKDFGISKDFCIYLEDENGRLILINNSYVGVGNPNLLINNVPCGTRII